jgi:hypothetical protein
LIPNSASSARQLQRQSSGCCKDRAIYLASPVPDDDQSSVAQAGWYFSGTATYTKTFDWTPPSEIEKEKSEVWLDLGEVQVMADVKLNGRDLGVLWKPPFRVNIAGALKPGRNTLEIRVADLWPNRMIGDQALPVSERFTWSSYAPFTKDTPLPKSGLLGPVTLQPTETVKLP